MDDKLQEIYDRIQKFDVASAFPSAKPTDAGGDIQDLLSIMADLVSEVQRIDSKPAVVYSSGQNL